MAGGFNNGPLNTAELYDPDPAKDTWSATHSLANARAEHTATILPSGKVLVAGGYDEETRFSWAARSSTTRPRMTWSTTGSLSTSRSQHTATLLPSGRVLVAGGLNSALPPFTWLTSAELYDPAKGTWSATGSLANGRDAHTATLLRNGRVLVAGGQ